MTDIIDLTLSEARDGIHSKKFTAIELTTRYIQELEKKRHLNAYITETVEKALQMAEISDKKIANGSVGKLEGLPLAIKDNYCTSNILTTAASRILSNFKPSYESTVTNNLWQDGAVLLGKANMDEFAVGHSNRSSYFGEVENPWRSLKEPEKKLTPGGSSGGSAAIVAAQLALAAIGSDTGGSIRQPAAFTGTVGLKPTYGRCSRYGIIAFASSFDQAGPMTRTVLDSAILLESMAGYDPKDSTSSKRPVPPYEKLITQNIKGLRVGVPSLKKSISDNSDAYRLWHQANDMLRESGAKIVDITLPHISYSLITYHILTAAELSSNLARYDGIRYGLRADSKSLDGVYKISRSQGMGHSVKQRILIGTVVLSSEAFDSYYLKAQKLRTCIIQDFTNAWKICDVISTPTTTETAFFLENKATSIVQSYSTDAFSSPVNLAGLPAISIPSGIAENGLPLGIQLIGKPFDEVTILQAAYNIEKRLQFKRPKF